MAKTIQELFHARSVRELFEDAPLEPEMTVRDAAMAKLEIREGSHPNAIESLARAWIPGDGDLEDHPLDVFLEHVAPSHGEIQRCMDAAREGHRIAEEFPERGAYHGGPPVEDMNGKLIPRGEA